MKGQAKKERVCKSCNQYNYNCECNHPSRIEQIKQYKIGFKRIFKLIKSKKLC